MLVSKELALILKEKGFTNEDIQLGYTDALNYISNEEVVNWIFAATKWNDSSVIIWLDFWYTTLIEHKFSLMYEFIGRLEEWFESNNIEFTYYNSEYHVTGKTDNGIIEYHTLYEITPIKQQAKHEAILKCFELLKETNNGNI